MARYQFWGEVKGRANTQASRGGTKESGITGWVRGWESGVRVEGHHCKEDNMDVFHIEATLGSGTKSLQGAQIATIYFDKEEERIVVRYYHKGEKIAIHTL